MLVWGLGFICKGIVSILFQFVFVEHSELLASTKLEYSEFTQWSENGVLRFTHSTKIEVRTDLKPDFSITDRSETGVLGITHWLDSGVLRFTHWPESEVRTSSPIWNQSTRIYPLIWFWSIRSYPLTIYRSIVRKKHWPNASYWQSIFDRHDLTEIMLKMVLNIKS